MSSCCRAVPDDIILEVIQNRVSAADCKSQGWVLDGFPENAWMAEHLHQVGVHCNRYATIAVQCQRLPTRTTCSYICLDISRKAAQERLEGRVVDGDTLTVYHERFYPPPPDRVSRFRLESVLKSHRRFRLMRWTVLKRMMSCASSPA